MHDPITLNIQISEIPRHLYWKTADGKVMLTVQVCERQTPSEKGNTHYATVYDKNAQPPDEKKKYIAYGKFTPFEKREVSDSDLPPSSNDIEDAKVVSDDMPF